MNISTCIRKICNGMMLEPEDISGIAVDALCRVLREEGVASLFYPVLSDKTKFPGEFVAFAGKRYEDALLYMDYGIKKLERIRKDLRGKGRLVLVQGMALADAVYRKPLARTMGDIDLFLPDGNADPLYAALEKNGFVRFETYESVWRYKEMQIDIHENLWGADRVPQRSFFAPDAAMDYVESSLVAGYFRLSDALLPFHTVFHALKHAFNRKLWYADLLLLYREGYFFSMEQIDKLGFGALAVERLASEGLIDPPDAGEYPGKVPVAAGLRAWVLKSGKKQGMGEIALALSCPSVSRGMRYMFGTIFVSSKVLKQMYGDYPLFMLYLHRIWSMVRCLITASLPKRQRKRTMVSA